MNQFELDDLDEAIDAEPEPEPRRRRTRKPPPNDINSFSGALDYAEPRPAPTATSGKGPYATRLSNAIAVLVANRLRPDFPGVLPNPDGSGAESRARTSRGFKKLDVNYSTPELGLALGVSIKTVNYRDSGTRRYTKNYSRNDNELRAEATDYHKRQPFSVLAAVLFLPIDACDDAGEGTGVDAGQGISSFGAVVRYFRDRRAPRAEPDDDPDLFEAFFIGLYEHDGESRGDVLFFDVTSPPPRNRRPGKDEGLTLDQVIARIRTIYDARNNPPFEWSE
jgi:hypothetical protein